MLKTDGQFIAQIVNATTPKYPVDNPEPGILVQILENVHSQEQSLFLALSERPVKAEQQNWIQMKLPDWSVQNAKQDF